MPRYTLTLEELQALFHLPREQAAASVGLSMSTFRNIVRAHGIARWPFCAEHGNKRNAAAVHSRNAAIESAQRGWTRESLLKFAHMPSRRLCKWLGMRSATFRSFHKSLGIAAWPYRFQKPAKRHGKTKVDGTEQAQKLATGSGGAKVPEDSMAFLDDRTDADVNVFIDSSEDSDDSAKCNPSPAFIDSAKCNPSPVFIDSSESSSEDDNDGGDQDEDALGSPVVHNSDAVCTGTEASAREDPVSCEQSYAEKILQYYELHGCLPDILAPL